MINSIVKWPGGKGRVIPDLLQHLPKGDCLVEPFVGGASVFLNTDYRRYVLGDINPDLINLYRQVTSWPDEVINAGRRMFQVFCTPDGYIDVRDSFNADRLDSMEAIGLYSDGPDEKRINRAAEFLFLNRHCYGGMVRYNRRGGFNVPYDKDKQSKPQFFPEASIRLFAEKANDTKAIFLCCPYQNTLKVMTGGDTTIYCDPPYVPTSKTANFTQYYSEPFGEKEHRQLAAALMETNRTTGARIVISNSDTPLTREIYHAFNLHEIDVQRSVAAKPADRKKAGEVIGVLKFCVGCGRHGGGNCPDCGPCAGYSMWDFDPEEEAF
ncbi:DNA adenine methylase [Cedecea davisae]|uniref:DNA adenine methylase n=1 Tax=Cedecea davisae TaxID=158484 RepID=UPI0024329657|nr:Dam family site-specific DNA-(adenine-N6)-methyltransferase [Cedecea davisae]